MLTYDIITAHAARYPLMQPTDAVKLAYQAAFGGGHLIRDEASCRRYLEAECASVVQDDRTPPFETISLPCSDRGVGLVRVYLPALDANGITAQGLCRAFIESAAYVLGQTNNTETFHAGLSLLRRASDEGLFGFARSELEAYLAEYLAVPGLPPVSHSAAYRAAYDPHYRVVCPEMLSLHR